MPKKIFLIIIFFSISLIAFLAQENVFALHTCSDLPLITFSDGSTSKTVTLPPGGGTVEAARIRLPVGSDICSAELTIDKVVATTTAVTPFIWIPASTQNKLIQLRTSDGSLVRVFSTADPNCGFSNPSRITLFPEGDIWVANRGNGSVTRLGRITGCVGDNCYECKGTYATCGGDNRGITYDLEGNIWAGSYFSNCLVRLCGQAGCTDVNGAGGYNIGDIMVIDSFGGTSRAVNVYGLIGDQYGNVWAAGPAAGSVSRINVNDNTGTVTPTAVGGLYGIGMDNEGDIWIGGTVPFGAWEIDGEDTGGAGIGVIEPTGQCTTTNWTAGLAVDGDNNVWVTGYSQNAVYVVQGGDCTQVFTRTTRPPGVAGVCTWAQPHGMAIDFDNHAWLVCDTGEAIKYTLHDDGDAIRDDDGPNDDDDIEEVQRIDLCALPGVGCGHESGATYNYSDMTGFRTPKISMAIGDFPIVATNYPQVINDINFPGFSASLDSAFDNCICTGCNLITEAVSACGAPLCEVPITVSSVFLGGDYVLSNLRVYYDEAASTLTGGLVPCGRVCDDPATALHEDGPCTLCHIFVLLKRIIDFLFISIIIPIASLMLLVGGVMLLTSAGNPKNIANAKEVLKAALIGFIIVFTAWVIVNFIVFFMVEGRAPLPTEIGIVFGQPWHEINCPFCGDGICTGGENNTNCPYDCP